MQISGCTVKEALICEGSVVEAQEVTHSIIGVRSRVGKDTVIRDTILIGNEYYKRPLLVTGEEPHTPGIGENCHIEKAIIDENVSIGDHVTLVNQKGHDHYDTPDGLICVRDGIMVIPRGARIPDNYVF